MNIPACSEYDELGNESAHTLCLDLYDEEESPQAIIYSIVLTQFLQKGLTLLSSIKAKGSIWPSVEASRR